MFSSFLTADLSADPLASLTISIGNVVFNKFDAVGYGTPEEGGPPDLGGGNLPDVEYINGQFAGVGGLFVNDTYFLQQDPVAYDEGFISYQFLLGTLDPLSYVLAGAYPTPGSVSIHAVPEPATWAMMLLGFGALGTVLRCRRPSIVRVLSV